MVNPDLELRTSFALLALLAFPPSVISSFLPEIKGGRVVGAPSQAHPLDPPLEMLLLEFFYTNYK